MNRRAIGIAAGTLFAVVAIYFVVASLVSGAHADGCARQLVSAVARRETAFIDQVVKNPSVRDALLAANHVELGFVRPMSTEHTRVGLFVKSTATSTTMKAIVLQLKSAGEGCVFLRDYETGPFGQ